MASTKAPFTKPKKHTANPPLYDPINITNSNEFKFRIAHLEPRVLGEHKGVLDGGDAVAAVRVARDVLVDGLFEFDFLNDFEFELCVFEFDCVE